MNDENTSIVTKIKTNYDYSESNSDGVKKPLSSITNFDQSNSSFIINLLCIFSKLIIIYINFLF